MELGIQWKVELYDDFERICPGPGEIRAISSNEGLSVVQKFDAQEFPLQIFFDNDFVFLFLLADSSLLHACRFAIVELCIQWEVELNDELKGVDAESGIRAEVSDEDLPIPYAGDAQKIQ